MSIERKIAQRNHRRALRVRKNIASNGNGIRISVFKSLKHIYAQIIDDNAHKTLVSCSTMELENLSGDKRTVAKQIGKVLAEKAINSGIKKAAFDRGAFLYHGRVKALAEGIREGGLEI